MVEQNNETIVRECIDQESGYSLDLLLLAPHKVGTRFGAVIVCTGLCGTHKSGVCLLTQALLPSECFADTGGRRWRFGERRAAGRSGSHRGGWSGAFFETRRAHCVREYVDEEATFGVAWVSPGFCTLL